MEPLEITFTSYRDSIGIPGLKLSIEKHTPKPCAYPVLLYLVMPLARHLSVSNMERICLVILDNNWDLLRSFVIDAYGLGIRQLVLCDWCTREQITSGKFCVANVIGKYIQDKVDTDREVGADEEFEFPVKIEYGDGRG